MRAVRASILLAISLSYVSYVFGIFHATFWQTGLGDWIDPYFINYLLEHWYHALATLSDPFSPPMFYPAQRTLGYSHGLFLFAPFYVPVRVFFHPFQAYSLSLFLIVETGIVCLYVIFRRFLQLSFAESLLLTVFFFTSPNVINATIGVWSQRASVFVIPPILLLTLISYQGRARARLILAGISGFLLMLLFPHDFYTGYFAFFFAAVLIVAWLVVEGHVSTALQVMRLPSRPTERASLVAATIAGLWSAYIWKYGGVRARILGLRIASQDWRRPAVLALLLLAVFLWLRGASRIRTDLQTALARSRTAAGSWMWAALVGGVVGCAVFLWIYLPAYREHPRFPEHDLLNQIKVRTWRGWTTPLQDLNPYETVRSFKVVLIGAIASLLPWFKIDRSIRSYLVVALALSGLVFLMPLQIDGFSIWLSFFRYVPGFSVIRDPTRIISLYELAFIVSAGLLLMRFRRRPAYRAGICLLFAYFLVTDRRVDTLDFERPLPLFQRWVEAPIDIDPSCRSFYIKAASPEYMSRSPNIWALYAGDAMFISLKHGLPTLNGYSAWKPEGWGLTNPPEPDYRDGVRDWIQRNKLRDVCELDIEARTIHPISTN